MKTYGRGSGRSIQGFDLHENLMKCEDLLESFGGHAMAIGLSIKKENLPILQKKFEQIASQENLKDLCPIINIDAKIELDDINREMVQSLDLLEPLGEANRMPIFVFENLKIVSIRSLSEGKHLKLSVKTKNNTYIDAIGFNLGDLASKYSIGENIDLCGSLQINSFNGADNVQIVIMDLK